MLKPYNDKNQLKTLKKLYGEPLLNKFVLPVDKPFPPPWDDERVGEVVMVLQRKDKKIWVMRKDSYPNDIYRLPTGGISRNENIILSLKRELKEETNLELTPKKFSEVVYYEFVSKSGEKSLFLQLYFSLLPC